MTIDKREVVASYEHDGTGTGSTQVQVALLTARINHLRGHFDSHSTITTVAAACSRWWAAGVGCSSTCSAPTQLATAP